MHFKQVAMTSSTKKLLKTVPSFTIALLFSSSSIAQNLSHSSQWTLSQPGTQKPILASPTSATSSFKMDQDAQFTSDNNYSDTEEYEDNEDYNGISQNLETDNESLQPKLKILGNTNSGKGIRSKSRAALCSSYETNPSLEAPSWRSFRRAPYGSSTNADARWNPLPGDSVGFEFAICRKDRPQNCNPLTLSETTLAKRYKKNKLYENPSAIGLDEVFCPNTKICRARMRALYADCQASDWSYSEVVQKPLKLPPPYIQYIGRPTYYDCTYDIYNNLICGYYYVNNTISLGWSYVYGAKSYLLAVCGSSGSASYCSYSGLTEEQLNQRYSTYSLRTQYTDTDLVCSNSHTCVVRIKAEADSQSDYIDSDWSYSASVGNID